MCSSSTTRATIRLALSRFLPSRGYEVESADSGNAALEALRRARTAADAVRPAHARHERPRDRAARRSTIDPDLAIVMLTAVNDAQSATDALSAGAVDYLVKPVELSALQEAVESRTCSPLARASSARMSSVSSARKSRRARRDLRREKAALRDAHASASRDTLINAMEAKDVYLRGHSHRVARARRRDRAECRTCRLRTGRSRSHRRVACTTSARSASARRC